MKDSEAKRARIMAAARLLQEQVADDIVPVDTVIVTNDRVLLAQGKIGEDNRKIGEIIIDDKTVEAFWKECGTGCDEEDKANDGEEEDLPEIKVRVVKVKRVK